MGIGDIFNNNLSQLFGCQFRIPMAQNKETLRASAKIST